MAKKDYIFSNQLSMFGRREIIGFGEPDFYIKEMPYPKHYDISNGFEKNRSGQGF